MQSREELFQNTHLAAVLDQMSVSSVGRAWKEGRRGGGRGEEGGGKGGVEMNRCKDNHSDNTPFPLFPFLSHTSLLFPLLLQTHTWLSSIKEVGMVAALAQLHENVEQLHFGQPAHTVHHINVLQQNPGVPAESIEHNTRKELYHELAALCTYVAVSNRKRILSTSPSLMR